MKNLLLLLVFAVMFLLWHYYFVHCAGVARAELKSARASVALHRFVHCEDKTMANLLADFIVCTYLAIHTRILKPNYLIALGISMPRRQALCWRAVGKPKMFCTERLSDRRLLWSHQENILYSDTRHTTQQHLKQQQKVHKICTKQLLENFCSFC